MEKWVEDFNRCEELVDEILEKVSLVIAYENQEVEKGSPLVRKQVEKETKIINGGFNILKCAGFWVERTSRKMREKSAKRCS